MAPYTAPAPQRVLAPMACTSDFSRPLATAHELGWALRVQFCFSARSTISGAGSKGVRKGLGWIPSSFRSGGGTG